MDRFEQARATGQAVTGDGRMIQISLEKPARLELFGTTPMVSR